MAIFTSSNKWGGALPLYLPCSALQSTATHDHYWLLTFCFVFLYKQQTGYLVNPGHLDIYSGAPGDNGLCLSPTAWCVDQCSSSVHFPLPWHTAAPAAECDRYCDTRGQTLNQIVTHSIKYKIKLITKALQLSGGCTALQMCTVCGMKRFTTMSGVLRFKKEKNPVSLWWVLVSGQKWLTAKYSQYSCL